MKDESLTDHNYITFQIERKNSACNDKVENDGWQIKKSDRKLTHILEELRHQNIVSAGSFSLKFAEICNRTMPKCTADRDGNLSTGGMTTLPYCLDNALVNVGHKQEVTEETLQK